MSNKDAGKIKYASDDLTVNQKLKILEDVVTNASMAAQRQSLMAASGKQFGGDRDVYAAAGYPNNISFEQYKAKYLRQGIAGRVVDAPADETWRKAPLVKDTDDTGGSDFMRAWADLTDTERVVEGELDDRRNVWHYLNRLDRAAGIGRYGVLIIGVQDGRDTNEPLLKNSVKNGTKGLLYLRVCDEKSASIATTVTDTKDRRYGLPETYNVVINDDGAVGVFHWTRVVHVAEKLLDSETYGTPRLERIYNDLEDLLKITAGSGESAWKLMYQGIIMSTKDGYESEDGEVSKSKAEEYVHGLMRVLAVEGMDVEIQGGEIVDPSPVIQIFVALISAATGIPQRILLGSERGELASSQDEANWLKLIESRQMNLAGPAMLRPLINRFIYCGILPVPLDGRYTIEWPSLFQLSEAETVAMNKDKAVIIATLSPPGAADSYIDENEVRELAFLPERESSTARLLDREDEDAAAETA